MIQSKFPTYYQAWGNAKAIVKLSVSTSVQEIEGIVYTVVYSAILPDEEFVIGTKPVFKNNEEIDQLNSYLESLNDYSGFSKSELEWEKIKDALLLDVQTNLYDDGKTVFRLNPEDWELSVL